MRGTQSGVKSRASERRVKTKNDDTSNPSFLSVPHNSFVIVNVIAFFRNIVHLYTVFMDFCINIWLMEKSWMGLFKNIDIVLFRNFPVQSFEIGFCGRAEINYVVNRA